MANTKNCPGCGNSILRNASICECGWGKPKGGSVATDNHDCAYQENQLRCRFPGAISNGTTGGGPWFCQVHTRDRGSMIASQVLRASQSWYAIPPVEDTTWLDENLPRHAGETQHDYHFRCRDFALPALKGFRPKPVVSSGLSPIAKPDVRSGELVEF